MATEASDFESICRDLDMIREASVAGLEAGDPRPPLRSSRKVFRRRRIAVGNGPLTAPTHRPVPRVEARNAGREFARLLVSIEAKASKGNSRDSKEGFHVAQRRQDISRIVDGVFCRAGGQPPAVRTVQGKSPRSGAVHPVASWAKTR